MNWTRGVLYLAVVALLYWWGVLALLHLQSRHAEDRSPDARWVHEQQARHHKPGLRKRRVACRDVLVYALLTLVLGGALVWVVGGFLRG